MKAAFPTSIATTVEVLHPPVGPGRTLQSTGVAYNIDPTRVPSHTVT